MATSGTRNRKRVTFHPATVYNQRNDGCLRKLVAKMSLALLLLAVCLYYQQTDELIVAPILQPHRRQSSLTVDQSAGGAQIDMNAPILPQSAFFQRRPRIFRDLSQEWTRKKAKKKNMKKRQRQHSSMAIPTGEIPPPPPGKSEFSDDDDSDNGELSRENVDRKRDLPLGFTTDISLLQYISCCGIGHRLARMSNAAHTCKRINYALVGVWPSCSKTNVFEYLFFEEDVESKNYTRTSHVLKVHNEVPGYDTVIRGGRPRPRRGETTNMKRQLPQVQGKQQQQQQAVQKEETVSAMALLNPQPQCNTCHPEKIASDYDFFQNLYERYRKRNAVELFRQTHNFANHTVLGMHIRAGNGEGGDFTNKGRAIDNTTQFVHTISQHIRDMLATWTANSDPPLLFIATDTPAMMDLFREQLQNTMPVIELQQRRPTEGQGILFGERARRRMNRGDNDIDNQNQQPQLLVMGEEAKAAATDTDIAAIGQCLAGWDAAFMDMMLLGLSDIVIATRRSSFVQTIPLSLVTGKPMSERKVAAPYCEVSEDSHLTMTCHQTYVDWCCCAKCAGNDIGETMTDEQHRAHHEYVKQPRPDLWDRPPLEWYKKKGKLKVVFGNGNVQNVDP